MKKTFLFAAIVVGFATAVPAAAQGDSTVKKVSKDIKRAAKKAGDKTAEVASKGKAVVTDEVYKGKVGLDGQTIYIDNHSRYYWVDKKGKRNYILESELKEKVD